MFTKKTNKILVISLLSLMLLCMVALAFTFSVNARATTFSFSNELNEEYRVNQVFTVPTATLGDTEANFTIKLPDGTYSNKESFTLKTPGSYLITYSANSNGKIYTTTKTFIVTGNLFTINGVGTSEYRNYAYENSSGEKVASGEFFTLYNGDSIVYNDAIDLSKFSPKDGVIRPEDTLFKISPIVSNVGEPDINQYEVILTDAYNEDNFVSIRFKRSGFSSANDYIITYIDASFDGGKTYCGAALRGTDWDGTTTNTNGAYYVDGIRGMKLTVYKNENKEGAYSIDRTHAYYSAYINNEKAGANIRASLTGGTVESPKNNGAYWVGIWYDTETNILYAVNKYGANDNQVTRTIIADFENADIFGQKFQGFTNNMVKITIKPTVFVKGSCGFLIQEFAGQIISEDAVDGFISSYEPEITVDYGEYAESNLPKVRKGGEYHLFDAKAFDLFDGVIPVKTTVYYGYNSAVKQQVQITNGSFTAKHIGDYTIVYSATNSAGKTVEKIITITSVENANKLTANLFGEPDYNTSLQAGKNFTAISGYEILNAFGNSKLTVTATLKSDSNISYVLDLDNGYSFTPIDSGEYEIKFTIKDYSDIETITRTLNVVASNNVYYVVNGVLPEYLIQNGYYNLNVIKSYTLSTGKPIEQQTLLYIDPQNGGSLVAIDGLLEVKEQYIYNGRVKLVFAPSGTTPTVENSLVKEIPAINAGLYTETMDKTKYLVSTAGEFNFTATPSNTECDILSMENGSAKFTFINYLNVNPFKIKLSALVKGSEFKEFEELNVYLYDPLNLKNYIVSTLSKTSEGWFVSVNGAGNLKLSNTWGSADDEFYVNFNAFESKLTLNNFFKYTDIKYFGTQEKAVFNNGAKLVVEIKGSDDCDGVIIDALNDATLDKYGDYSEGQIDFTKDNNAGEYKLGEVITLLPFTAYDVFAPYLDLKVQVLVRTKESPLSEVVFAVDGTRLMGCDGSKSYQFELKQYGIYSVQVSAKDENNSDNNTVWDYSIVVTDYTKPEVEIVSKTTTYSIGSKFSVPKFTVNLDDYSWIVTIKLPNSQLVSVTKDISYTFVTPGKHLVTLMVYDANFNIREVTYTVTVK